MPEIIEEKRDKTIGDFFNERNKKFEQIDKDIDSGKILENKIYESVSKHPFFSGLMTKVNADNCKTILRIMEREVKDVPESFLIVNNIFPEILMNLKYSGINSNFPKAEEIKKEFCDFMFATHGFVHLSALDQSKNSFLSLYRNDVFKPVDELLTALDNFKCLSDNSLKQINKSKQEFVEDVLRLTSAVKQNTNLSSEESIYLLGNNIVYDGHIFSAINNMFNDGILREIVKNPLFDKLIEPMPKNKAVELLDYTISKNIHSEDISIDEHSSILGLPLNPVHPDATERSAVEKYYVDAIKEALDLNMPSLASKVAHDGAALLTYYDSKSPDLYDFLQTDLINNKVILRNKDALLSHTSAGYSSDLNSQIRIEQISLRLNHPEGVCVSGHNNFFTPDDICNMFEQQRGDLVSDFFQQEKYIPENVYHILIETKFKNETAAVLAVSFPEFVEDFQIFDLEENKFVELFLEYGGGIEDINNALKMLGW